MDSPARLRAENSRSISGTQAITDKLRDLPGADTTDELRLIAKYLNASEDDLYLRERASETEQVCRFI